MSRPQRGRPRAVRRDARERRTSEPLALRRCPSCGGELPERARADAVYDSGACRARLHRSMPAQTGKQLSKAQRAKKGE